ncbi:MAG: tRNA 2-thiouridine(34) synthase MnmA, partial [Bacteroidetes bacterium]|nr:tRNA 2-thiouridine(34) synthase MnmA [Bacteroidota bacterium]
YRSFLKYKLPEIEEKYNNGNFISTDGKILGKHKGFPFYTIGQRKGLEIAVGEPLYVNKIVPETNTIVLGNKADLMSKEMVVSKCNFVKYAQIPDGKELMAKVRYKDKGTKCKVFNVNGNLKIEFSELVSAITPGQSAVIYENNDLVAGGFIE